MASTAFFLPSSRTFAYICVVVIFVWPSNFDTVNSGAPLASARVANVCLATWNDTCFLIPALAAHSLILALCHASHVGKSLNTFSESFSRRNFWAFLPIGTCTNSLVFC